MSLLVNAPALLRKQLALQAPAIERFANGKSTRLEPVRYVPAPADPALTLALDGEWRVKRWPFAKASESELAAPRCDDRRWETAQQPGKIFYQDAERCLPEVKDWNRVTLAHINPEDGAVLRRKVRIPAAWAGKRIRLRFDAIYPAGRIYLDGALLGEHLSGLTPIEFDVTSRIAAGKECVVAVRLLRKHKHVQLDMPRHALEFAGLAQSACFYATEPLHLAEHHLAASLDAKLTTGTLAGTVTLNNAGGKAMAAQVSVVLLDAGGKTVAQAKGATRLAAGASAEVPLSLRLSKPALWNDEFPNLYAVRICVTAPGQKAQTVAYRTGFRRLDLAGGRPRLNGRPVKFRGVNHLTYHPDFGMHTPREWLVRNLSLMKKANVNAIRTHFLGPRDLAEVCDELGIYLLQELPIDWGTDFIHDPEWVGPAMQRVMGGVLRDRHHPSVMVWSVGNENMPKTAAVSEDGYNHLRLYDRLCKELDPTRPTMFPPPGPANKIAGIFEVRVGDIADTHYSFTHAKDFLKTGKCENPIAWTAEMRTYTRKEAMRNGWSGCWFSSEYGIFNMQTDVLNSPYLSIISDYKEDLLSGKNSQQVFIDRMKREWGFMRNDPSCLGGAYFPWLCSATGNNPWGWTVFGEDADWGVVTADLLPKSYFWALRVMFSPVRFPQRLVWKKGSRFIEVELANQFNAIDLADCTLRVMMGGGGEWMTFMNRWKDVPMRCAPGKSCKVRIPLADGALSSLKDGLGVAVRCTLLDPSGFRVVTHEILVVPPRIKDGTRPMPIGPDAVM